MTVADLLLLFLMYVVVPLWLAAGLGDYFCHRIARIELTSGFKESLLHLLQFGLVGVPLLAMLFLQVNAAVLLIMIIGVVLHQTTAMWDVRYANATRRVPPLEQHLHGVLEAAPAVATAIVAMLHWSEVRTLFGKGTPSFDLIAKHQPLPSWYLVAIIGAAIVMGAIPFGEELLRTWRARSVATVPSNRPQA